VRSLDVRPRHRTRSLSYGNIEGGRPVEFTLEKLAVASPRKAPPGKCVVRCWQPGDRAPAQRRTRAADNGGRVPIDFSARSGGVRARIHAYSNSLREPRPELSFEISARARAARWQVVRPAARATRTPRFRAKPLAQRQWSLADFSLQLGRTTLTAEAMQTGIGTKPLLKVRLAADQIDRRGTGVAAAEDAKKRSSGPVLNIPFCPRASTDRRRR